MSPSDDADFFTKLVSVNLEHNDLDAALASLETAAARSTTATQRSRAASAAASLVERLERGKDLARAARARGILASLESGRREDPRPASLTETPPAAAASREVGRAEVGQRASEPGSGASSSLEIIRRLLVAPELVERLRTLVAKKGEPPGTDAPLSLPVAEVVARLLSVELDVSRTAEVALDLVARATNADRGFLILADGAEAFGLRGGQERPPETSEGILREVQRTNETVLVVDAASDARFGERGSIKTIGARSVLAVPVRDPDAATIAAVIYLDAPSAPARFGARERELAEALAGAIAVPLGNARRFEAQSLELDRTRRAFAEVRAGADDRAGDVRLLGKSLAVQKLRKLLDRVAPGNHTVLIEGESGTGKELVARWLHARSERARGPFVAENLGALSEGVLEAELFGHAKGAFTGADRARPGLFQVADRGTLFLDEVAEIGPELQKKLLRVLQEREVRPVGGTSTVRVDIRVLAATNRNLDEMVRAGTFREDLFYRLGVIRVRVPTLRERKEDVPLLFEHFVARAASEQRRPIPETTRELERRLLAHAWPGNVRELEAFATRFLLEGPGAELGSARAAPAGGGEAFRLEVELGKGPVLPLREVRQRLDKAYLALVLQRCDGKVSVAAKALEMDRTYISDLVKRFQLREGSPPPA